MSAAFRILTPGADALPLVFAHTLMTEFLEDTLLALVLAQFGIVVV